MASGGLAELAEDLECPICREGLTVPKVLTCKHVFCANCLQQMVTGARLLCPICRHEQLFDKYSGVSALPEPLIIRQLQEKIAEFLSSSQFTSPISSTCGFCTGRATYICAACMKSLCDVCTDAHRQNKVTRTHRLILVSKWTVCQRHGNELVNGYCRDCRQGLCVVCINSNHSDHDVIDIKDDALVRERRDLLNLYKVKTLRHSFNNDQLLRELNTYTRDLTSRYDVTVERLDTMRQDVNAAMDKMQDELKKQMAAEQNKLDQYRAEVSDVTATEKSLYTFIDDVLYKNSHPDIIGASDEIPDLSVNSVSVPPKCKLPQINEAHARDVAEALSKLMTLQVEEVKSRYMTSPSTSVEEGDVEDEELAAWMSENFTQPRDSKRKMRIPSQLRHAERQDDAAVRPTAGEVRREIRQTWETTLRRPVTDVVWDRDGAGWWMRTCMAPSGPGGLSFFYTSGEVGDRLGAGGLLHGKGVVCVDTTRNLLVTTDDGKRVLCLTRAGQVVKEMHLPGFTSLSGIIHCRHDNVYIVSDIEKACLLFVSCDSGELVHMVGNQGNRVGNQGNDDARLVRPLYLCHQTLTDGDVTCHVLVSDAVENCVKVFTTRGDYVRTYGHDVLKSPLGVNVGSDGRVLVCDSGNIRVVSFWWEAGGGERGEGGEEKHEVMLTKQQLGYRAPHCIDVFNSGQYLVLGMKGCEGVVRGFTCTYVNI